ncbi:hypothetical protein ACFLX8_01445 [Chloroflexota bacterium]
MAGRVVTLEVDTTTIRLMETIEGRVVKWASLSLDSTMVEGEVTSDSQILSTAVRQLMSSSGIAARDVVASVSALYSVSRIVAVSNPSGGGVADHETVIEAARDVMPLTPEELYLYWQPINAGEDAQQTFVVGVPRDVIDIEMQAMKMAGINVRVLDLKTIALARAVNKEQALILNIEPSNFDIVIVVNGIPEVMRTIAWQQDSFTMEDKVEHLAMNLEMTAGFFNLHHPDAPLGSTTPFLITGQMSGDLDLVGKLEARVGYPIESLAPPLECPKHMPVSQYAVNIGLALKGTKPSKSLEQDGYLPPDINLLPEAYKPWKPSNKQLYYAGAVIAAIALLFPLYQVTSGAMDKTADLQLEYTSLNNELQLMQLEINNREPLKQAIAEYKTIVDMGGGFTEDLRVINSEAERLGVQVESIAHQGKSINVNCQTDPESYIVFRDYLASLEGSGRFVVLSPPPERYPYLTGGAIELEPSK